MKWLSTLFVVLILVVVGIYYILDPEKNELNEAVRAQLGGTYITLSDGVTHYKLEGSDNGRVVVLVHGGTVPIWTWDKQVRALTSEGFRTLTYDKYGRGYSDRPDIPYDQDLYKKQLLELVDKLSLTEPFDVVGLSLGGGTAVNFTAHYPDRVRKLVLISPLIKNFKVPSFFHIPVFGEFMARIAGVRVIINRFISLFENNPDAVTYTRLFKEQTTYKGFQRSMLSMLRNDAVGDYSHAYRIVGDQNRDILLVWGTADTEITQEMIDSIRSFIPRLTFQPVEGVGHGIVFQKTDTVNQILLGFLLY